MQNFRTCKRGQPESTTPRPRSGSLPASSAETIGWLPKSYVKLTGKRDTFDAWLHKFCSKLMHPTAMMIMVPEAIADEPKRTTLCFAGLQYLGNSYNNLTEFTLRPEQATRELRIPGEGERDSGVNVKSVPGRG